MQINPWDGKSFGAVSVREQVETSLRRLKVSVAIVILISIVDVILLISILDVILTNIIIIVVDVITRWITLTSCIFMLLTIRLHLKRRSARWISCTGVC